jgi:aminomethyltransferase
MTAEQAYSPAEIGLGRLVDPDKGPHVGQPALAAEARAGGPARRLVGLELDWAGIDALHAAQDLPPVAPTAVSRAPIPIFDRGGRQVGRATSTGWSPLLKKPIALGSVPPAYERPGSRLSVEWTVEGRRGRVDATVVTLPFLELPRKRD